jgi:hypothetical protein
MEAKSSHTPPELVFPPQVPFAWTLRGAHAAGLRAESAPIQRGFLIKRLARRKRRIAVVFAR